MQILEDNLLDSNEVSKKLTSWKIDPEVTIFVLMV